MVSISPSYPIPAYQPNRNRFLDHDYSKVLFVILPSPVWMFDFPVRVTITYYDVTTSRRQHIYFNYIQSFLSMYNHSDFIKMRMQNAWSLGQLELAIDLPSDYFVETKFLCFLQHLEIEGYLTRPFGEQFRFLLFPFCGILSTDQWPFLFWFTSNLWLFRFQAKW